MEIILSVFVFVVLGIFIVASRQPDEFKVTRSLIMLPPPAKIFPYINNLKTAQSWSPWVEMEPDANYTFQGPEEGVGAIINWEGKKTGKGKLTIIDSVPNELVRCRLDFYKPMVATNTAEYILKPEGEGTIVTWTMYGSNNYMSKVINLFMNCEKMCGDQFEKGLLNLSRIVK